MNTRRSFLKASLLAGTAGILSQHGIFPEARGTTRIEPVIRFGVLTDLHHDIVDDGPERLKAFIDAMIVTKPDFIVQLGDFCVPKPANQVIMDIWSKFTGAKHHVIGNHDNDGGFSHDEVVRFWNATNKYYSFDLNGYHFVILNGNEEVRAGQPQGYPNSISVEQRHWLRDDIDQTKLPVIVFCHQALDNDLDGLKEGNMLRILFERANQKAGFQKVRLVLSGHHHEDYLNVYNDIHYLQINSISYQFARSGRKYAYALTADPIWALISLHTDGTIRVEGKRSTYKNASEIVANSDYDGYPTVPYISDRIIKIKS